MNNLLTQAAATPLADSTAPTGIIYFAYNTITEKGYVGQTRQRLERRRAAHFSDKRQAGRAFHGAIAKYGRSSFEWIVLTETADLSKLDELEKLWILALGTHSSMGGYNVTFGGDGINTGRGPLSHNWGRKRPDTSQRNREHNPMTVPGAREKMIRTLTGRKAAESAVAKRRGRKCSEEQKALLSEALRKAYREGRKVSKLKHTPELQRERLLKAYRNGNRTSKLKHTPELQRARAMKRWHPEG